MKPMTRTEYLVGTSGFSFADWVGPFYPPGVGQPEMFDWYVRHFPAVELNFTFYRMPAAGTMERLARRSPAGFQFWVKVHQSITHGQDKSRMANFLGHLQPLAGKGKLAGVLLQFPQSFHRTVANRKYLAETCREMGEVPVAVEFRHCSWHHPATFAGLSRRGATLVIPDAPPLPELFSPPPMVTTRTGYLRLHSRSAGNWYAGGARYDYRYSQDQLQALARQWTGLEAPVEKVYAFFNNCHRGQAAVNAAAFGRIVRQLTR